MRVRWNLRRSNFGLGGLAVLGPAFVALFLLTLPIVRSASAIAAETPSARGGSGVHSSAAEHPEDPDVLKPEPSLAGWTAVVFVLLLLVLSKYAWKPMFEAMKKREEEIERVLAETERARTESDRLLAEHRKQMQQAAEQVKSFIEQGRRDAQAIADEIRAKAEAEAKSIQTRAKQEIETARDQALSEIWKKTADLAATVASRVLHREMNSDDHRRLVDAALNELPTAGSNPTQGVSA